MPGSNPAFCSIKMLTTKVVSVFSLRNMKIIIGLGNPGKEYEHTRHNVGWNVIDKLGFVNASKTHDGLLAKQENFWLFKPQTFMNSSGIPTLSLLTSHHFASSEIVVVHDDLDIPLGDVRVKNGGGHGGHNGVRSIIEKIGKDFTRIKCGIGRPREGCDVITHVLSRFYDDETEKVQEMTLQTVDVILKLVIKDEPGSSCEEEKALKT